jgi:hypothetical protein
VEHSADHLTAHVTAACNTGQGGHTA